MTDYTRLTNIEEVTADDGTVSEEITVDNQEDALKRLWELENAIEEGTLIHFPRVVEKRLRGERYYEVETISKSTRELGYENYGTDKEGALQRVRELEAAV